MGLAFFILQLKVKYLGATVIIQTCVYISCDACVCASSYRKKKTVSHAKLRKIYYWTYWRSITSSKRKHFCVTVDFCFSINKFIHPFIHILYYSHISFLTTLKSLTLTWIQMTFLKQTNLYCLLTVS